MAGQQPSNPPNPTNPPPPGEEAAPERENTLLNLGFNIAIPVLLLNKGKDWFGDWLRPWFDNVAVGVLLVALAFPIGYFVYDYVKRAKYNIFSILGLVSVLLTGGIGVLEIPTEWFAVKEAAIPLLLGLAVLLSLKTRYPLVRTLLFNREILHVDKVQHALRETGNEAHFDQLLVCCTRLLAASFILSALLNYGLARWIVESPSGTDAFNAEVGRMMAWSWPIIVVPSMVLMMAALWILLRGIRRMTGLDLEAVLRGAENAGDGGGEGAGDTT